MRRPRVHALAVAFALAATAVSAQPTGGGARFAACMGDVAKFCQGVERGGGRIAQCLRQHRDQLSDGCKSVLAAALAQHRQDQANQPPPSP